MKPQWMVCALALHPTTATPSARSKTAFEVTTRAARHSVPKHAATRLLLDSIS